MYRISVKTLVVVLGTPCQLTPSVDLRIAPELPTATETVPSVATL